METSLFPQPCSALGLVLTAKPVPAPEGGPNLRPRFSGLKATAPSEYCSRHQIAIQKCTQENWNGKIGIKMRLLWPYPSSAYATTVSLFDPISCSISSSRSNGTVISQAATSSVLAPTKFSSQ